MDSLRIPQQPGALALPIERLWNGDPCPERYRAAAVISQSDEGVMIRARANVCEHGPDAPVGTRVDGLWETDVVEVFIAGENGAYLEVELGAFEHWLVLGFDDIRHRSHEYADFKPKFTYTPPAAGGAWQSEILIPWEMIPSPIARINAFAIFGEQFLAFSPMPGREPDFHQPAAFPAAVLDPRS